MIPWLREKQTPKGVRLRVGGYLPPFRARVFSLGLGLVAFVAGCWLALALLANDRPGIQLFRGIGIPVCFYYMLCLLPLFTPALFILTPLGQMLGELLVGSRFTIFVAKEYIQVVRWLVYRPKFPLGPGIAFERHPHPKTQAEIRGNELRKAAHPKNPAKAMQFFEYQKSQVVVFRCGPRVVRLANIFDRKPVGLGHKADLLVQILQRLHRESQTGNRSTDVNKTPMQYGTRPSIA